MSAQRYQGARCFAALSALLATSAAAQPPVAQPASPSDASIAVSQGIRAGAGDGSGDYDATYGALIAIDGRWRYLFATLDADYDHQGVVDADARILSGSSSLAAGISLPAWQSRRQRLRLFAGVQAGLRIYTLAPRNVVELFTSTRIDNDYTPAGFYGLRAGMAVDLFRLASSSPMVIVSGQWRRNFDTHGIDYEVKSCGGLFGDEGDCTSRFDRVDVGRDHVSLTIRLGWSFDILGDR